MQTDLKMFVWQLDDRVCVAIANCVDQARLNVFAECCEIIVLGEDYETWPICSDAWIYYKD